MAASAGGVFAIAGALVTQAVAGEALLITTAVLIFVLSVRMLPRRAESTPILVSVQPFPYFWWLGRSLDSSQVCWA